VLEPEALITTVTESYERISMHGVHRELLARQAEALGIPLVEVAIPPDCVNDVYDARMADAFATAPLTGVEAVAFGDLFLDDVRAYRDGRLAAAGKRGLFPLWGHDTAALARKFIDAGFEATLVCVDPRALDPAFCGRRYDERLLAQLPPGRRPLRRERRIPHLRLRGPDLRRASRLRARRDRRTRWIRLLRPDPSMKEAKDADLFASS
jgi:diphthamide synthase (EF-2-diphthine--ammonia ligase)